MMTIVESKYENIHGGEVFYNYGPIIEILYKKENFHNFYIKRKIMYKRF